MPSPGMWCRVDLVLTDVSEERIASIFMVEKYASEEPGRAGGYNLQSEVHVWQGRDLRFSQPHPQRALEPTPLSIEWTSVAPSAKVK
jgi:hypothetical protein